MTHQGDATWASPRSRSEPEAVDALLRYRWPGNVRELENLIERVLVLSEGPAITVDDLPDARPSAATARRRASMREQVLGGHKSLGVAVDEFERDLILEALQRPSSTRRAPPTCSAPPAASSSTGWTSSASTRPTAARRRRSEKPRGAQQARAVGACACRIQAALFKGGRSRGGSPRRSLREFEAQTRWLVACFLHLAIHHHEHKAPRADRRRRARSARVTPRHPRQGLSRPDGIERGGSRCGLPRSRRSTW